MSVSRPPIITLSTTGQVILPKPIRDALGWDAGARLVVERTSEGVLLRPLSSFAETNPDEVFGCLPFDGAPKSLAEMEAGVLTEARRRHAGG
ncbi:MAG: AbrB/MazE/SpoVT family DNA-binding domain-containing protein [Acidobacteriota bacterium]|nr:AbrB/MazE/SpoVT family DNA-binding domain-containing protein [Acidobacteriota bacterium]